MAEAAASGLKVFHSLWGFRGTCDAAIAQAKARGFDGLEANLRHSSIAALEPTKLISSLRNSQLELVVEVITGGDYVPDLSASPEQHLAELSEQLARAEHLQPERITLITGSDS